MTFTTWFDASRDFKTGDVLRSTGVLETYPHYWINSGARLIVLENSLNEMEPVLYAQIVPADKHLMSERSDISEWNDILYLTPPDHEGNSDEGVAWDDWQNEGHACAKYPLPVVRDNEALPLAERLAAVFANKLSRDIGAENMARVVERNKAYAAAGKPWCSSHDFCDANEVMYETFKAVGISPPTDFKYPSPEFEAASNLWIEALGVAMAQYYVLYAEESAHVDPETDEEDEGPVDVGTYYTPAEEVLLATMQRIADYPLTVANPSDDLNAVSEIATAAVAEARKHFDTK